ncbi:MAG: gliding motility-associated C-terminal domain-containing protein [Chitinophagaceae bacterium]
MRRIAIVSMLLACCWCTAKADHITGGEMYYSFVGMSGTDYQYSFTLKLFMRCNSGRQFNNPTIVSVFDRATGLRVKDVTVSLSNQQHLTLTNVNPCISNPPEVCYDVGYYNFTITLPASVSGYLVSSQVNFRIAGISNLSPGYGNVGATYTAEIPGTATATDDPKNNSAVFSGDDMVVICADNSFTYDFSAKDADGDILRYSFGDAYISSSSGGGPNVTPPGSPPYSPVPYNAPTFDGRAPLGPLVQVNPSTGMITGIAPTAGIYVITVYVDEIRGGKVIATQRKDLQVNIAAFCSVAAASLLPEYMFCKSSRTIAIENMSTSTLINSYSWRVLDRNGNLLYSTTGKTLSYTPADTGTYIVKLAISTTQGCSDSATALARVYPGFAPDFSFTGICFTKPTSFIDATTTVYGQVNSWNWDFGEASVLTDVSVLKNPVYTYPAMGAKTVRLITTNSVGCRDTAVKVVDIVDRPPITLAFRDTLICIPDNVQLHATGSGVFSWTPLINAQGTATPDPVVAPVITTKYYVNLDDNGCINRDSVLVRVTDKVSVTAMADTTICQTDTITMRIQSDGLRFSWVPAEQFVNPNIANAQAITATPTTYTITARIGSCFATDQVKVATIPYPAVNAGPDTTICFNTVAQLHATTDGTSFNWLPVITLSDGTSLRPVAKPLSTTSYVLTAISPASGCPKPSRDTVTVKVLPDIKAFAGRDTAVVVNQPLQFQATGGVTYIWQPPIGLSRTNIANPVGLYTAPSEGIVYKVLVYNEAGCVDSASVRVKVFNTLPMVFVPNAFTPNSDGKNDVLKPITAGIHHIDFFAVYNRWGQMVYHSSSTNPGWDGTLGGKAQPSSTFAWMVKAVDYTGAVYIQRGTVTLIR